MNVPTKSEVRGFTRSWDNKGYPQMWTVPGYALAQTMWSWSTNVRGTERTQPSKTTDRLSVSLLMSVESNSGAADARAAVTGPSAEVEVWGLTTLETDRRTDGRHAIAIPRFAVCTIVHRAVINIMCSFLMKLLITTYDYYRGVATKFWAARS